RTRHLQLPSPAPSRTHRRLMRVSSGHGTRKWALSASMWSVSCDSERVWFVWEVKGDRSACEERERERGLGVVEAAGAAGEQADLVVERLGAALVDAEADRGEDPVAVSADGFAEPDERFEAAARRADEEPVDEHLDVLEREAGLEDPADGS